MFEAWTRRWRLSNEFRKAFRAAFEAPDLYVRIAAAQSAIALTDQIDPWPSFFLPRQRAAGRMHTAMGRAYAGLRDEDPRRFSRLAVEEMQRALESLTPDHGVEWAVAMTDLSIAHADDVNGRREDNLERAIEIAEAALGQLDRRRDRMVWMSTAGTLAQFYAELHRGSHFERIEKAISLLESVLVEATRHATPFQRAHILLDLGTMYAQRRKFDKEENIERAIQCIEEGLAAIPPESSPLSWATGQVALANVYAERTRDSKSENFRKAFRANDAALTVFERIGAREQWARTQMIRAALFENCPYADLESNTRQAIEACERALSVLTEDEYPAQHDEAVRTINHLRGRRPTEDRAATLQGIIDECERMLARESDPAARASTLVQLGNAYAERMEGNRSENMERSIECLDEAVTLFDQRAHPVRWGLAMNNLAQSCLERNEGLRADNIEKALAVTEAALVVVSSLNDPDEHSALLETLGTGFLNRVRGDRGENLEKAVQIFAQASGERNRDDNPEAWLRLQQKWREALGLLNAIADRTPAGDGAEPDVERYFANLQAYTTLVSATDHPRTWVAAQLDLADAYTRIVPPHGAGDFDSMMKALNTNCRKALEIYEGTAGVVERMNDDDRRALVQDRIGHAHALLYLLANAPVDTPIDTPEALAAEARRHYAAAVAAHAASLRIRTLERSPRDHLRQAVHLARLHTYEREWQAADEWFAAASRAADRLLGDIELSESDMKSILHELGRTAMLAPLVALMLDQPARALELAEAGRARLLAKALSLQALPLSGDLRGELHALQRQVAAQERRLVSPRLFDRRTPLEESKRLRQQIRTLVDRSDVGGWFKDFRAHAREAMATENSVIVVPVLTERGGRIVIAVGRGVRADLHVIECPAMDDLRAIFESPLPARARGWQQDYIKHSKSGIFPDSVLRAAGESLGESFATPLVQALENLGIPSGAQLDILPQGPLGILPLGLAVDGSSGMLLLERYELSLSPSLTALHHARARAAERPGSLLTVANPDRSLPFAETESAFLRKWFTAGKYLEGQAVAPQAILDVLPGHAVWHFATHGTFKSAVPLQSGLELGNDRALTLEMLFETSGLGAPRLVVLSACETGLYDLMSFPGEFIGLPTGFIQAGAAGVIGTLWPVGDASTALLMGCFYEKYIGDGHTPSAALRAAQLWLRGATRDELVAAVQRWAGAGPIPSIEAMIAAIPAGSGAAPYASAVHWSGFVHYGV